MTIDNLKAFIENPAINVAGFCALCGIPDRTLRNIIYDRRGKRGLSDDLKAKLRHGMAELHKHVEHHM